MVEQVLSAIILVDYQSADEKKASLANRRLLLQFSPTNFAALALLPFPMINREAGVRVPRTLL